MNNKSSSNNSDQDQIHEFTFEKGLIVSIYKFKKIFQYFIGFFIIFVIFIKLLKFYGISLHSNEHFFHYIVTTDFLIIVSQSLLTSAVIELTYMLFTPGPDEAVDPLIVLIASSILFKLSDNKEYPNEYIVILSFVICLFILFYLRHKLKEWFPEWFCKTNKR